MCVHVRVVALATCVRLCTVNDHEALLLVRIPTNAVMGGLTERRLGRRNTKESRSLVHTYEMASAACRYDGQLNVQIPQSTLAGLCPHRFKRSHLFPIIAVVALLPYSFISNIPTSCAMNIDISPVPYIKKLTRRLVVCKKLTQRWLISTLLKNH